MKRCVSQLMILVWLLTNVIGCNSRNIETENPANATEAENQQETAEKVLIGDEAAQAILTANLLLPDVTLAVDTFEALGYSYREECSLVMIQEHYKFTTYETNMKTHPDGSSYFKYLDYADTVVWQVFENPQFDSTRHTAVFTGYHLGEIKTGYVELDVSTSEPFTTQTGLVLEGLVIPGDPASENWRDISICIAECCSGCAVYCWLMGPGYLHCLTTCCAGCATVCLVGAILRALF